MLDTSDQLTTPRCPLLFMAQVPTMFEPQSLSTFFNTDITDKKNPQTNNNNPGMKYKHIPEGCFLYI